MQSVNSLDWDYDEGRLCLRFFRIAESILKKYSAVILTIYK